MIRSRFEWGMASGSSSSCCCGNSMEMGAAAVEELAALTLERYVTDGLRKWSSKGNCVFISLDFFSSPPFFFFFLKAGFRLQ